MTSGIRSTLPCSRLGSWDSSASRFGDSSIGDTCGTISPFFSVQSKPLDFACSFGLRTSGKPQTLEVGVILDPNFFEGLFFEERSKVKRSKLGVILLRSIPLLVGPFGTPQRLGGGP